MKLSFKFKPSFPEKQLNIIDELSYVDIENAFKSNWYCDFLHSYTRQQAFKVLEQNWKSYFASIKDYKVNPHKYNELPKLPKFKNMEDRKNEIIFTNLAIRFQDNILKLSLLKAIQKIFEVDSLNFEVSNKFQSLINWNVITKNLNF